MKEVKRLASVRLNYDFVAYGVNTSQLSENMVTLKLAYEGGKVIVTSPSRPGEEKHILAAGIKELTFKTEEQS